MTLFDRLEHIVEGEKKEKYKESDYEIRVGHESYSGARTGPGYGYGQGPYAAQQPGPYGQTGYYPLPQNQQPGYYPNPNQYYPPPPFPPPQLPPGWISRLDENYRTNYYVNTATGVSQWIFPSESRGLEGYGSAPIPTPVPVVASGGGYYEHEEKKIEKEKKGNKAAMVAAGVGGVVLGGVVGAVAVHEWEEHEEKERREEELVEELYEERVEESSSDDGEY